MLNPQEIKEVFKRFRKQNPNPTTELVYSSPFELLIAVILSAQATDKSVNIATAKLFPIANTPEAILQLGEKKLKSYVNTIGLYNTKVSNILKTCKILMENFASQVPQTREELESLPGVGRKTANVILNTCFNHQTVAVDTHVFRVANRTGLVNAKTTIAVEEQLMARVPKEFLPNAHHWLILHGRYTCTARVPKCPSCIINDICQYPHKTRINK